MFKMSATGTNTITQARLPLVNCVINKRLLKAAPHYNLPDNLPDKASPGETGSASRVTQTEIVYKVTHLYNVFPIGA